MPSTATSGNRRFERYVYPILGSLPVGDIDASLVVQTLEQPVTIKGEDGLKRTESFWQARAGAPDVEHGDAPAATPDEARRRDSPRVSERLPDWATERTGYPREVIEMALTHSIGNKVEAAYRRGDLFEKRRQLMQAWARFCAAASAGEVLMLRIAG
jgi:hypothetical protein